MRLRASYAIVSYLEQRRDRSLISGQYTEDGACRTSSQQFSRHTAKWQNSKPNSKPDEGGLPTRSLRLWMCICISLRCGFDGVFAYSRSALDNLFVHICVGRDMRINTVALEQFAPCFASTIACGVFPPVDGLLFRPSAYRDGVVIGCFWCELVHFLKQGRANVDI